MPALPGLGDSLQRQPLPIGLVGLSLRDIRLTPLDFALSHDLPNLRRVVLENVCANADDVELVATALGRVLPPATRRVQPVHCLTSKTTWECPDLSLA